MQKIQEEATTKTVRKQKEAKRVHKRKIDSSLTNFSQTQKKENANSDAMDDLFQGIKPFDGIEV